MTTRDSLQRLAGDYWTWRSAEQPQDLNDVARVDRPTDWAPAWSAADVTGYLEAIERFETRWRRLAPGRDAPIPDRVDWHLIGSAIARARNELADWPMWRRNPRFYVDQTVGAIFEALLHPPPYGRAFASRLLARLRAVPRILESAAVNLDDHTIRQFGELAVRQLDDIAERLSEVASALSPLLPDADRTAIGRAFTVAGEALRDWHHRLREDLPTLVDYSPPSAAANEALMHRIALHPESLPRLRFLGEREADRAAWLEDLERARAGSGPPGLPTDAAAQAEREAADELAIREFYEDTGLLSQPPDLRHYRNVPMPPYLKPLAGIAVAHYPSGIGTPDVDAVNYIADPSPALPFIAWGKAIDSRTGIAHEGAHAQQLALSRRHPDPVRRYHYDSGPVEGIAYYNEELLLRAGLFDDAPHTRVIMCGLMRLRALRVILDIDISTGTSTLEQAADRFATEAPRQPDPGTPQHWAEEAMCEIIMDFAERPLRAMTYQTGKTQLLELAAEARLRQGDDFDLRAFHDYVWRNGNVPIALLRCEYLNLPGELDALDELVTG